jgi:hypothetical protein
VTTIHEETERRIIEGLRGGDFLAAGCLGKWEEALDLLTRAKSSVGGGWTPADEAIGGPENGLYHQFCEWEAITNRHVNFLRTLVDKAERDPREKELEEVAGKIRGVLYDRSFTCEQANELADTLMDRLFN